MSNPGWLNGLFAGVMLAVAVYSAGRLVVARAWSRPTHADVDVAHVLMGVGMAGMLVSDLNPLPIGLWEVVFSLLAVWFIWRCYQFVRDPGVDTRYHDHVHRLSRRLIHLTMALAMIYMYLSAVPSAAGSGGSMAMGAATGTTADFAFLPMVFIFALLGSSVWALDGIGRFSPSAMQRQMTPAFAVVGAGSPARTEQETTAEASIHEQAADVADAPSAPWLASRSETVAHIAMCLTMAYMLVLML
ncbi:MAG TPA: DUF5134 domain-containing protein [Acidimicrobiales bacterium]|nr:DUF5134 domain-containing protein [Acidimicrobiales bacterium]